MPLTTITNTSTTTISQRDGAIRARWGRQLGTSLPIEAARSNGGSELTTGVVSKRESGLGLTRCELGAYGEVACALA